MDKKLTALIVLFLISFAIFAIVAVFNKPITEFTRAKDDTSPSPNKSKIIAWPLAIKADGISKSTISIFVISQSDKPLANKVVTLLNTGGQLTQITSTTDNGGKADFYLTSVNPGTSQIEAVVEPNVKLSQKVTIKFE